MNEFQGSQSEQYQEVKKGRHPVSQPVSPRQSQVQTNYHSRVSSAIRIKKQEPTHTHSKQDLKEQREENNESNLIRIYRQSHSPTPQQKKRKNGKLDRSELIINETHRMPAFPKSTRTSVERIIKKKKEKMLESLP